MAASPITWNLPDTRASENEAGDLRERALSLTIASQAELERAAGILKTIKDFKDLAEQHHRPIIEAAHKAHNAGLAALQRIIGPLDDAERLLKARIGEYHREQERLRIEAQRALEEEACKLAEAEIEKHIEAAEAAGATAAEIEAIIEQPIYSAPVIVPSRVEKIQGLGLRDNWKAQCLDKAALIKAAATDSRLQSLLTVDQSALNQLARALRTTFSIPGCKAYNESTVSVRR